jgi:uncharacterized protein (TIGR03435 family)
MKLLPIAALGVAVATFAQTPAPLAFEVASIRPWQASDTDSTQPGLGLRLDGSQAHITRLPLDEYIAMAYRVRNHQVTGPDWMGSEKFDLNAKLPAGTNADQIPDMVRTLLIQRFGLKVHREQKELPIYALARGHGALKLVKSAPGPQGTEPKGAVTVSGSGSADGVSADLGHGSSYTFKDGKFEIKKVSMETLAKVLERYLDRPVVDMTGIGGEYDLSLEITEEDFRTMLVRAAVNTGIVVSPRALRLLDTGSIASLMDGLQQLGLGLDARKAPLDMIVVDQVSKMPADN